MPKIVILPNAREDIKRLVAFLYRKSRPAAENLRNAIDEKITRLQDSPYLGSPFEELKRVFVRFSRVSVYEIVYFFNESEDMVFVISIKHGKEDPAHPAHGQPIEDSEDDDDEE